MERSRVTPPAPVTPLVSGETRGSFFLATRLLIALAALLPAVLAACGTSSGGGAAAPATSTPRPLSATAQVTPSAATTTYPATFTDGAGRQVRLEKSPQKIVAYGPGNTETLYAIGAGDRIVGVDNFSDYPEQAKSKPKLGGVQPNLEALIALQPDLVITAGQRPDFVTLLQPHNITVFVVDYKDIPGTLSNIELIGRLVGRPAEATKLTADMRARMEAVQAKTRGATKVRVYYELDATDPTNPYTAGPGSFVDGLLAMSGASNIAAGATGQYPKLNAEEIVRANPEVIVVPIGNFSAPDATSPARFAARPGWANIEAVKQGAIRGVADDPVSRPGPRLVDGLDQMAKAVHPELFK